jgi:hypothetical protein
MPTVQEVALSRHYSFQYENFVVATQQEVFLLLEKEGTTVHALRFPFTRLRYGGPNDEARGGHPLAKCGLGFYGLYQVEGSPWLQEVIVANRVHPSHSDEMFADKRHYIVCFKDVMLEVIGSEYQEVAFEESELFAIIQQQLGYLE